MTQKLLAGKILEEQFARSLGLSRYASILKEAKNTDISQNASFQHAYNAYYRVRRNAEWRKCYYKLFEKAKAEHLSFADVVEALYTATGNIEASFSSKMIATIDPNKPIWDQYVLQNLGLKPKGSNPKERIANAAATYYQIEQWYSDYLLTEEARENIAEFDRRLPSYRWLSPVKKIDFLLWAKRSDE